MEEFLLGVFVGVIGARVASRSTDHGFNLYMRLTEWLNSRRFNRLKTKATAAGFGNLFDEEWHATANDDPRHQRGMEAERAFRLARDRFLTEAV